MFVYKYYLAFFILCNIGIKNKFKKKYNFIKNNTINITMFNPKLNFIKNYEFLVISWFSIFH